LVWSANKHKAENDLLQIQNDIDAKRTAAEEELRRLEAQKQEKLTELSNLGARAEQLNLQIAQREAQLSSMDEEKKQLDRLKAENKMLEAKNQELQMEIDVIKKLKEVERRYR
jgi:uncharacterized protein (DUF3084 family)